MYWSKQQLEKTNKIERLKLINAISGIKPANLVGTKATDGTTNLAIISSVLHLSSRPATMGFIMRPTQEIRRDTYHNICATEVFSINHIPTNLIERAHYTSAKFPPEVSEFDTCGFTEKYLDGFEAPFVKESPVQIGLSLCECIPIKSSGTVLLVGSIEHLFITDEDVWDTEGYLNLEKTQTAGIAGLNSYYKLAYLDSFPYARLHQIPEFNEKKS